MDDIVAAINCNINMKYGLWQIDNIDHLANRRVRSVGELLQNQFRIGIARLERVIREQMSIAQDPNELTPQSLINIRPRVQRDKGIFRKLPAVAVYGSVQPHSRAYA